MKKLCRAWLAVLALVATCCGDDDSSPQEFVKMGFEAEVQDVSSWAPDLPVFPTGTRVVGWFSYELPAPDSDPSQAVGWYRLAGSAIVEVGDWVLEAQPGAQPGYVANTLSSVRVDGYPRGPIDRFQWIAAPALAHGLEADTVEVHLTLFDASDSALASDALPRDLSLTAFTFADVDIYVERILPTGGYTTVYALRAAIRSMVDCSGEPPAISELCPAP
jgi:hypothetical protein